MEPVRVLQVVAAMDCGGMETFIMNVYRSIDRSRVQFDFLCHYEKPGFYDQEIESLGGRIYKLSVREDNNFPKYFRDLDAFFRSHHYPVIHCHYSGFGMFYCPYARKHGTRCIMGHSHSDKYEQGLIGQLDRFMSKPFRYCLTDRFACSEAAGRFLFGKYPFTVFYNGIDMERFLFSRETRQKIRSRYGIPEDSPVIGHVGRFAPVKNHEFLLRTFAGVYRKDPRYRLMLLGTGAPELVKAAEDLAAELGISQAVIFAGVQKNVADYYNTFDLFALPSLFEGIPLCLMEAQANGLRCLVSDAVNSASDVTGNVEFQTLDPALWETRIPELAACGRENTDTAAQKIRSAGYDIRTTANTLQDFYLKAWAEPEK